MAVIRYLGKKEKIMSIRVNSNDSSQAAISALEVSCKKLGISKSDPLVQGLVQILEKTKPCADQIYSFNNGADHISATFAKEGSLTRLEIKQNQQPLPLTLRTKAIIASTAMASVAVAGAVVTTAVVQIAALPSLYDTACKIVPSAAKIIGGLSVLAGVLAYRYSSFAKSGNFIKIHGNRISIARLCTISRLPR